MQVPTGHSNDDCKSTEAPASPRSYSALLVTVGVLILWTVFSISIILVNKYILYYSNFQFPVTLAMIHMAVATILCGILYIAGIIDRSKLEAALLVRSVLPVALCFTVAIVCGNIAFLFLSVSLIQMLKSAVPVVVFVWSLFLRTETHTWARTLCVFGIGMGVAAATYGEVDYSPIGVCAQLLAVFCESGRVALLQPLLQQGFIPNSLTLLLYLAPLCCCCLAVPFFMLEYGRLRTSLENFNPVLVLASAFLAFGLNLVAFLIIGRTSAMTMTFVGLSKDWLLIMASVLFYGSTVTTVQLVGYAIALTGVFIFSYLKANVPTCR